MINQLNPIRCHRCNGETIEINDCTEDDVCWGITCKPCNIWIFRDTEERAIQAWNENRVYDEMLRCLKLLYRQRVSIKDWQEVGKLLAELEPLSKDNKTDNGCSQVEQPK